MIAQSYDKIPENDSLLIDLPFREATGAKTFDHAKPHHEFSFHDPGGGAFAWLPIASGLGVLQFITGGGSGVYLKSLAADTVDLNITIGSYSIGCWVNWEWNGTSSILIGRYIINQSGWETYFDISGGRNTLSQRHHHLSLAPNTNSNCYSTRWTPGVWHFLGITKRAGSVYTNHYRNGGKLVMSYETTGMLNPDTCNQDLIIGARYTLNANWYKGYMQGLRFWNRPLAQQEWRNIFERERVFFGV